MKVLVIDDEKATLTMFRLVLAAQGYDVLVAEDGRTGLALVAAERPPIVFTDLKMPEMDGFEVLKQIKKIAAGTEVIVITGHGDMDMVVQALNLEATDFINKPISRQALAAALHRARARLQTAGPCTPRIEVRTEDGVGIVRVGGALTGDSRTALAGAMAALAAPSLKGVVIDFDLQTAINGAGITALIRTLDPLSRTQPRIVISGLSDNFRTIFETVGVTRFARLTADSADALALLAAPVPPS